MVTAPAPTQHATFTVASKLKDYGVSQANAVDLLADHWNPIKAFPEWSYEELSIKVSNAYQYGADPIGKATAQADFPEDLADILPAIKRRDKLYFLSPEEIDAKTDQVHLIEDLLSQKTMSVLYGESNVGKTFVALKLAYCIATGTKFQGRRTEEGVVIYVTTEGGASVLNRVVGLKEYFDIEKFKLATVPCPVDLIHSNGDLGEFIDLCEDVGSKPGTVKLVIIDTLSRALSGGNENDSVDMGAFVKNIDKIRLAIDAHLLVVHHSGKDTAKGARGHSLLRAATDTELEIRGGAITARKQRDFEMGTPIAFELVPVELGTNRNGRTISTCVMQEIELSAEADFDDFDALSTREQTALEVFKKNENEDKELTFKDFRTHLEWTKDFFSKGSKNSFYRAVSRTVDSLVEKGRLEFNKQQQLLRRLEPSEESETDD